jgi:hypothetical protein
MMDAYKQTEFTTSSIKGACVEWPWLQKKTERILISIPVPQVRGFIQPKRTVATY